LLTTAQIGAVITFEVTASNSAGNSAPGTSTGTSAVLPEVPVNSVLPAITGTAQSGDVLTGSNGTWTNSPTGYTYRWLANGVAIGGATANTFTLTDTQIGTVITFEVTASNAGGSGTPATSSATSAVLPAVPVNSVLPAVSGTAQVGQVLSATNGTWTNSPTGYTYQWFANGTPIAGQIANVFTLTTAQIGEVITIQVTASNSGGSSIPATSVATSAVLPEVPVNSTVPVITGTAQVGQTLSGSDGTWTNTPTSYAYQWLANGTPIGGATANTFLLTSAQLGDTITFTVTASNAGGSGSPATSSATSAVIAAENALATDWAARVVAHGGASPSSGTVTAISNFCDALDAASLTAKMFSLNVFAPDNSVANSTPLIKTFGDDPWAYYNFTGGDFTIDGIQGDGATKYIDTQVIPSTCATQSSVAVTLYVNSAGTSPAVMACDAVPTGRLALGWSNPTYGNYFCAYDFAAVILDGVTSGYFLGYICGSKTSSTVRNLYEANSFTPHSSVASNSLLDAGGGDVVPTGHFYVLASNENGATSGYYPGRVSFASISSGLTAADSIALYNAVQSLRVAFGGGWV
jgi:hypothetical protein